MPRVSFENGVIIHECEDWIDFNDFITERLDRTIVWRGQRDAEWQLEPTLSRLARNSATQINRLQHLARFQSATRGRRGQAPKQIPEKDVHEWWSLGQHHGLATPLLDWTHSPYVAAFFAYSEASAPRSSLRAVYGLVEPSVSSKSREILDEWTAERSQLEALGPTSAIQNLGSAKTVNFIRPLSDENQRLINQNGLFTISPIDMDIESWVTNYFPGETSRPRLYKILLPDSERSTALKSLNRMNINFLSLYPDLEGASLYCNMALEIEHY